MGKIIPALRRAFPYTVPVLIGYLFIGLAFGVMFAEQGYSVLWAILMSTVVYAGSGQYLAVNFFVPGMSLVQAVFLTVMVNIRHVFYGLSLVERFNRFDWKRWYLIFGMTDETYSLICTTDVPEDVDEETFLLSITFLNQVYWIVGTIIGSVAATVIPFNSEGIEFAMTALFLVLFVEMWMRRSNRFPELLGALAAVVCLLIFGTDGFVLPTMILVMAVLLISRRRLDGGHGDGEGVDDGA
ncbi:MAG: AzlC family ABC transporter permease [Candidatus Methanomethylophilaceae archaeon]|nr:AzlC family ABC transporter permease [Candidatus Methanomethylophilaceae archaeon]